MERRRAGSLVPVAAAPGPDACWRRRLARLHPGTNPGYPEQILERDLDSIAKRLNGLRRDNTPTEKRLADNMLDYNPAAIESLVQLMWGALLPGRDGGLVNARLRYFDPDRQRAGVPEDVAALVSQLSDTRATVTLINLNPLQARTHRPGRRLRPASPGQRYQRWENDANHLAGADGAARSGLRPAARADHEAIGERANCDARN